MNDNNRLIAEFLGYAYCERYQYEGWYKNHEFNNRICDFDGLKFHTSWDDLMNVIRKIEHLFEGYVNFKIDSDNIKITVPELRYVYKSQHEVDDKLEATYKAVVEFIKWYNKYGSKF